MPVSSLSAFFGGSVGGACSRSLTRSGGLRHCPHCMYYCWAIFQEPCRRMLLPEPAAACTEHRLPRRSQRSHSPARLQRRQRAPNIEGRVGTFSRLSGVETGILSHQFLPRLCLDWGKNKMSSENCWLQETRAYTKAPWTPPNVRRIYRENPPLEVPLYAGAGKKVIRPTCRYHVVQCSAC